MDTLRILVAKGSEHRIGVEWLQMTTMQAVSWHVDVGSLFERRGHSSYSAHILTAKHSALIPSSSWRCVQHPYFPSLSLPL